jgi:hypothetical protein
MGAWGTTDLKLSYDEVGQAVRDFCETEGARTKAVTYHDLNLSDEKDAVKYLEGKGDKWGNAVAVSYLGLPEGKDLKQSASLKKRDEINQLSLRDGHTSMIRSKMITEVEYA